MDPLGVPSSGCGTQEAQPFLKWAGGKSQLLTQLEPFFPTSITSFIEPFIGGGAVYFHLQAHWPGFMASLRDNNVELINCYHVVRDDCRNLMLKLNEHRACFRAEGEPYYYLVRKQHSLKEPCERAARMIFLNKTCYNGLWRVNSRGKFNVPIGSYSPARITLYDEANLLSASDALRSADIEVQDFRQTMRTLSAGDFAYIDPPYFPLSPTANFTAYTRENFGAREQEELAMLYARAANRGAKLMLSNSDTPFIRRLYKDFAIHTVNARRAVNSDGAKRGRIPELVVLNYVTGKA